MGSRMESTGVPNKIQCSQETADLLQSAGHSNWTIPREDLVTVKGKGLVQTYFVKVIAASKASMDSEVGLPIDRTIGSAEDAKTARCVEWNVEVLSGLLRAIVARREATSNKEVAPFGPQPVAPSGHMVLDEVAEIITLPKFCANTITKQVDPETIELDSEVVSQLSDLISKVASMYRANPFHNFGKSEGSTGSLEEHGTRQVVSPCICLFYLLTTSVHQ